MHRSLQTETTSIDEVERCCVNPILPNAVDHSSIIVKTHANRMILTEDSSNSRYQMDTQGFNVCRGRVIDLDRQVCNIFRQKDLSISQSQSFSYDRCLDKSIPSYNHSGVQIHDSRSSAYMSPPSPQWITVGNIMTVKRSASMPGSRSDSVSSTIKQQQYPDNSHNSIKKKNGPLQCLKYQLRRAGHKSVSEVNNHETVNMKVSGSCKPTKTSVIKLKQKQITTSENVQNSSSKSRDFRKSISMFFSKSNRSSKSDSYIINQMETLAKQSSNCKEDQKTFHCSSKRNCSYESMIDNTEKNKMYSFSDVQESLSLNTNNDTRSVDTVMHRYSPNAISLSDSISLYSNDHLLSSQSTSLYGNNNYNTNDTDWKSIVGNVCRSNSKDSAIANSTLSGDGMLSQSKRISLTSNISRTSGFTTALDDFTDSSYSSFNDLQVNPSQLGYFKPRLITNITKSKPIHIDYTNIDPPENSDISPSSDSSTETLRPMSHLLRRRYLSNKDNHSSHSNIIVPTNKLDPSIKTLKKKCIKRSHSWPGCHFHMLHTTLTFKSKVLTKPPLPPKSFANLSKSAHQPSHKMDPQHHKGRFNSSPLLSQYSRLYSLRSSLVRYPQNPYFISGQHGGFTQAQMSSIKQVGGLCPIFLRPKRS